MMLVSTISYIDRNTLAILSPTILAESHLSDEQYGWIISAFSVAYMVANPLWGRLLDRCGWDIAAKSVSGDGVDDRYFCLAESRIAKKLPTIRLLDGWHSIENGAWRWTKRRPMRISSTNSMD